MVQLSELVKQIIAELHNRVNHERKEMAKTYYPTAMQVIGVTNPDIRDLYKTIKPILKTLSPRERIDLVHSLLDTNIFECMQFGFDSIIKEKKIMTELTADDVRRFDRNQDNWVSVDYFSACFLGVAWREGLITDQEIQHKIDSENFWHRRQALVATLGWNQKARGGTGNTEKTLWVCQQLIDDHHDMINKALSWALRELSKTDKPAVEKFMVTYHSRLHGRVRREVGNKLLTGLKNPK